MCSMPGASDAGHPFRCGEFALISPLREPVTNPAATHTPAAENYRHDEVSGQHGPFRSHSVESYPQAARLISIPS